MAQAFKLVGVVEYFATKKSWAVRQCGFINNNGRAFSLDSFHDSLNGRLPEIIATSFHCQTPHANYNFLLAIWWKIFTSSIRASKYDDIFFLDKLPTWGILLSTTDASNDSEVWLDLLYGSLPQPYLVCLSNAGVPILPLILPLHPGVVVGDRGRKARSLLQWFCGHSLNCLLRLICPQISLLTSQ